MSISVWSSLRFIRDYEGDGYVLQGIPGDEAMLVVFSRLFELGCTYISCGCSVWGFGWVRFQASPQVAGHIALRVPCESGTEPLWVGSSGKILSGAAEARARGARGGKGSLRVAKQLEVGRKFWGC